MQQSTVTAYNLLPELQITAHMHVMIGKEMATKYQTREPKSTLKYIQCSLRSNSVSSSDEYATTIHTKIFQKACLVYLEIQ